MKLLLSVFLGGFLLGVLAVVAVVLYALNRVSQGDRKATSLALSAIEKSITDEDLVQVFHKFIQESSDGSEEGMCRNVDPQRSLDFTHNKQERESWDMNTLEKIEAAGKKKEEANALFKAGKYARASKRYEKAVKYIEHDSAFSEEEKKQARVLKVACNLNNAACKLKLKDYKQAEKLCTKVLDLESRNVKALYRRAQAYIQLADLDLAELDIKKALEIDPYNWEVKLEYKTLKEKIKEYNKKEAKFYGNMFAKMNKLEPLEGNKSAAKESEPMSIDSKAW